MVCQLFRSLNATVFVVFFEFLRLPSPRSLLIIFIVVIFVIVVIAIVITTIIVIVIIVIKIKLSSASNAVETIKVKEQPKVLDDLGTCRSNAERTGKSLQK